MREKYYNFPFFKMSLFSLYFLKIIVLIFFSLISSEFLLYFFVLDLIIKHVGTSA